VTIAADWSLVCDACGSSRSAAGLPSVCDCGQPWLVRYGARRFGIADRAEIRRGRGMWRFSQFLPLAPGEDPVTLGEGDTPLLRLTRTGARIGLPHLLLKDEGANPTGSFKARGLSAAVTRARAAGATRFTLPTAGNAGVAASAYAARAGATVRVFAPRTTPATILSQITAYGGELVLLDGHIGDCGRAARAWSAESGAVDLSTLREPYRIEGKKTLGLELAMQLDWRAPHAIIYPTGGGTGLIGMWKAFQELAAVGWVTDPMPRFYTVQSTGCAPVVRAFEAGAERAEPWSDPWTVASGLRVPGPLGDRLMLQALRVSRGGAIAVPDEALAAEALRVTREEGVDLSPEGGASIVAAAELARRGALHPDEQVVVFNTGAGWLYRDAGLPLRPG
jgi:threonine synthase